MADVIFEHVSGTISILATTRHIVRVEVEVVVRNMGRTSEDVRVVVHIDRTAFKSAKGQFDTVAPGDGWGFRHTMEEPAGGSCWISVETTSRNLVPSVEFRAHERHEAASRYAAAGATGGLRRTYPYAWISPGDFTIFTRLGAGGPLVPDRDDVRGSDKIG